MLENGLHDFGVAGDFCSSRLVNNLISTLESSYSISRSDSLRF